jgi:hypothetical protein
MIYFKYKSYFKPLAKIHEKMYIKGISPESPALGGPHKPGEGCNGPRTTMAYLKRKRIILNKT